MQEPEENNWELEEEFLKHKREEYRTWVMGLDIPYEDKQDMLAEYDENLYGG